MTLFSYVVRWDDGAAPNPYGGICSLVICKPVIRRTAKVGDWIVGTGSKNSKIGDVSGRVVYAMKVTKTMPMRKYDEYTTRRLRVKMPDPHSHDFRRRTGDSIYDYSKGEPVLREGSVHKEKNKTTDLRGNNALLSRNFVYFGNKPVRVPKGLLPVVLQGQGHQSRKNEDYANDFLVWWRKRGFYGKRSRRGKPQMGGKKDLQSCAIGRCDEAEADEKEESHNHAIH